MMLFKVFSTNIDIIIFILTQLEFVFIDINFINIY